MTEEQQLVHQERVAGREVQREVQSVQAAPSRHRRRSRRQLRQMQHREPVKVLFHQVQGVNDPSSDKLAVLEELAARVVVGEGGLRYDWGVLETSGDLGTRSGHLNVSVRCAQVGVELEEQPCAPGFPAARGLHGAVLPGAAALVLRRDRLTLGHRRYVGLGIQAARLVIEFVRLGQLAAVVRQLGLAAATLLGLVAPGKPVDARRRRSRLFTARHAPHGRVVVHVGHLQLPHQAAQPGPDLGRVADRPPVPQKGRRHGRAVVLVEHVPVLIAGADHQRRPAREVVVQELDVDRHPLVLSPLVLVYFVFLVLPRSSALLRCSL
ncbi:hypothetical protein [Cyprinid herpesvirus 3]|uniref:Uncharacterized protein n=1 Tax=Cyprinid herpesvirus 3 TaxID=180230 RepID=A4FTC7_CYHV3|nr:hypothetical protein [Cyprinid herpesvirus 3]